MTSNQIPFQSHLESSRGATATSHDLLRTLTYMLNSCGFIQRVPVRLSRGSDAGPTGTEYKGIKGDGPNTLQKKRSDPPHEIEHRTFLESECGITNDVEGRLLVTETHYRAEGNQICSMGRDRKR